MDSAIAAKHTEKPVPTSQAAEEAGLSESNLEKRRLSGDGPEFIKLGRRVLYYPSDIRRWLESNKRLSTSDIGVSATRKGRKTRQREVV